MTTKTETAILAVVTALTDAAESTDGILPVPLRNEDLLSRLSESDANLKLHLNVLDGERIDPEEMLGADFGNADSFDITQRVDIEWAVAGGTSADREARFDAGRKAIWDAVKPQVSGDLVTYLGGAVNAISLVDIVAHHNTNVSGAPNVKACVFVFDLTFTSSDPF